LAGLGSIINPRGVVQGRDVGCMLDEAIGLTLSSEEFPVTVEIKVCFIAGTKSGRWSEPERLSTWAVPFALSKDA
jgi:hypothetical protein